MRENILLGKIEIMEYLKISGNTLDRLIRAGLPAKKIGSTWCSHTENIEMFFKTVTKNK
jgi:hypothetical protein